MTGLEFVGKIAKLLRFIWCPLALLFALFIVVLIMVIEHIPALVDLYQKFQPGMLNL